MRKSLSAMYVTSLLMVMGFLLLITWGGYALFYQNALGQARETAQDRLRATADGIEDVLRDMRVSGELIARQTNIKTFSQEDPSVRFIMKDALRALLTGYADFKAYAVNCYLYTAGGSVLSGTPEDIYAAKTSAFLCSRRMFADYALKTPFRQSVLTALYPYPDATYYGILIPIYKDVPAPQDRDYLGALAVLCQTGVLANLLPEESDTVTLLEMGPSENVATDEAFSRAFIADPALTHYRIGGVSAQVYARDIGDTGWRAYIACAPQSVWGFVSQLKWLCWIVALCSLAALSVLMLVQYRGMVEPIIAIARQTDAVALPGESIRNPSAERNELVRLTQGINGMLRRVEQLNTEMIDTKLKYYQEQVMFLQSQINPHFLYNGFESIRGMAAAGRADAVREMASCMAAIYRYGCREEHLVPLKEEYACLTRYGRILQLRYDDAYRLELFADARANECLMPRMLLQPLVENSIRHGFEEGDKRGGRISVRAACENGALRVVVADNGAGVSDDMLARLNQGQGDDQQSHIGLSNVRRRMALLYGAQGSLRFTRTDGGGLTVIVQFGQKS